MLEFCVEAVRIFELTQPANLLGVVLTGVGWVICGWPEREQA